MLDVFATTLCALAATASAWLVFRRPQGLKLIALGVACGLACFAVAAKLSGHPAIVVGPTILSIDTTAPLVALTLDDGPTPDGTEAVLKILGAHGARATFFVTGEELAKHPEQAAAIVAAGHELGNHSVTHRRMIFRSSSWMAEEIDTTDGLIAEHQPPEQRGPPHFRPPYGKRLLTLHAVLDDRPAVLWDVAPESDPEVAADPDRMVADVLSRVRPGSILLLHVMYPSRATSVRALPGILDGLAELGLRATTLSEVLASAAADANDRPRG